ncbi:hypothetical protein CEE37_13135 [candidate division LCP-89 bacterium B3_LCP]|uniref:DUF2335 domain-containing protein n=1 Tax=candidate division LCP-89 bacterium B3_LCP TaxID=2012998 RepID=A0A532USI4_UNCL8|nr:MAG: hypothetical protein CEE37_13135 [candidate division LCP-89 bacterium B3_LCP]
MYSSYFNPETIAKLEDLHPGACERLFNLVEKEQQHLHMIDQTHLEAIIADAKVIRELEKSGQRIVTWLCYTILALGTTMVLLGHPWVAASLFTTVVAIVLGAYVFTRRTKVPTAEPAKDNKA